MSKFFSILMAVGFFGCTPQQNTNSAFEAKVAKLEKTIDDLKPDLGEIMGAFNNTTQNFITLEVKKIGLSRPISSKKFRRDWMMW